MDSKKRTYKKHRHPGVRPKGTGKWTIDFMDHVGKRHQRVFKGSEKDAVKFRNSLILRVDRIKAGLEAPPSRRTVPTLKKLWEEFRTHRQMQVMAGSIQQSTLTRYHATIKALKQSRPTLLNQPISKITARDIESYKSIRIREGVKAATINADLRNLKALFNYACKHGYIDRSPLSGVSNVKVNNGDVRFLNEDELARLKECLQGLDLKDSFQKDAHDLVIAYLYTGCRAQELLVSGGLTWDQVGKDNVDIPQPKQHRRRIIRLPATVQKILSERRGCSKGPFDLTYDQAYKRVKYVLSKAKIDNASIHTLRKTAGAWYYIASRGIFATSLWLGHSNVLVTQKHYTGLIQRLETEYNDAFERMLDEKVVAI